MLKFNNYIFIYHQLFGINLQHTIHYVLLLYQIFFLIK
jgi:hypothetical protein